MAFFAIQVQNGLEAQMIQAMIKQYIHTRVR